MIKKLRHTKIETPPKISITKIHFKKTLFIYFNFPTHNTKLPRNLIIESRTKTPQELQWRFITRENTCVVLARGPERHGRGYSEEGKPEPSAGAVRAGKTPGARNLREGSPREEHQNRGRSGHQDHKQGKDPEGRFGVPHQARDIHPPPRPPPQHRPTLRSHGHQNQDLLRHGVRARRRALQQGRQGKVEGRSCKKVLPAAGFRGGVLPRTRGVPQGHQARKFVAG